MEYIDKLLRRLRKEQHMTLSEVALATGYTVSTLSQIETGKRKNVGQFETIEDMIHAYGYEFKIVKAGIFKNDIIEWETIVPDDMVPDMDQPEWMIEEYGRAKVTKDEYLIASSEGIYSSKLYEFPDGKLEDDGYVGVKPMAWMELPHYE